MSTMTDDDDPGLPRLHPHARREAVWDAITKPEWTERYGYGGVADYDLRVGGRANCAPGAAMSGVPGRART